MVCVADRPSKGRAFAGKISLAIANKIRYDAKGYSAAKAECSRPPRRKMGKVFENLAVSSQHSAFQPMVAGFATLCRLGLGLGLGLGGPWVAQGATKGHARATQALIGVSAFVCNESAKMAGGGEISPLINTDNTDLNKAKRPRETHRIPHTLLAGAGPGSRISGSVVRWRS